MWQFNEPEQIVFFNNSLFLADTLNQRVRQISCKQCVVSVLLCLFFCVSTRGLSECMSVCLLLVCLSLPNYALLFCPFALCSHLLSVVTNRTTTIAGVGTSSNSANISNVRLNDPSFVVSNSAGTRIWIADSNNHCIKIVSASEWHVF